MRTGVGQFFDDEISTEDGLMVRSVTAFLITLTTLCLPVVTAQEVSPAQARDSELKSLPFPKGFEPARYLGKWHEAARLPTPMQPAGTMATAEYSRGKHEAEIIVKNTAFNAEGKQVATITGHAQLLPGDPPRLAVSFGPVAAKEPNYFVMHVDKNYQHAVVGTPDRKSLWILTRKVPVPKKTLDTLIAIAHKAGFDTQKLIISKGT
jgi:apolipoprotein D and lipocalin family protein